MAQTVTQGGSKKRGHVSLTVETQTGQTLAHIEGVRVVFNKSALFGRHWLPSRLEVTGPLLSLDFKGPGWPNHALRPAATAPTAKLDFAAFQPFLPVPGVPFALEVRGFAAELKAPDRTVTWHFQPIITTLALNGDDLKLDLALGLEGGPKPVSLRGQVTGKVSAHVLHFDASIPAFRTEDLPPLPLDASALPPAKLGLAFEVNGSVDLDHAALPDLHFHLLADNGELRLPALKPGGPILLHHLEAAGRATDNASHVAFETLDFAFDSVHLVASGADLITSGTPSLHGHFVLTGPNGDDLVAWLPSALAKSLPFPADALRELGLSRLETDVDAKFTSAQLSGQALSSLALSGQLELALGTDSLPLRFRATLPARDQLVRATIDLTAVRPAAFAGLAVLKNFPFVRALDLRTRLSADLAFSPAGVWRTARVSLASAGPGTLHAFGALPADVPVRTFALEAEASALPDAGQSVRISTLTFDFDGPTLSVGPLNVKLPPALSGPIEADGRFTAENFPGSFLAGYLPPAPAATPGGPPSDYVRDRLSPLGLAPSDIILDRLTGNFTTRAAPGKLPDAATFQGSLQAHMQQQPLALAVEATLAGQTVAATLDLARVNPSAFHLTLPGDPPLDAVDVPVQLHARVTASLDGKLQGVEASVDAGPGVVHSNRYFRAEVPVTSLKLAASTDGAFQNLALNSLALDLDGVRLSAGQLKLSAGTPGRVSGTVTVENVTVTHALALWPGDLLPAVRDEVVFQLEQGELTRASFTFAAPFDSAQPGATRPSALTGDVRIANLRTTPPQAPGPVTLQELSASIAWPGAKITVTNLAGPGITVPVAAVSLTALDQPEPLAESTVDYTLDLAGVPAWLTSLHYALPPDLPLDSGQLSGRVTGRLQARAPLAAKFDPARVHATLDAAVPDLHVPLTLAGYELGQGDLSLQLTADAGSYAAKLGWRNFHLAVPGALEGPVTLNVELGSKPAADEFTMGIEANASAARLLLAGDTRLPALAPFSIKGKATGWLTQPKPQLELSAHSDNVLGAPLVLAANATYNQTETRMERVTLSDFKLGRTALQAEVQMPAAGRYELSVTGDHVDTPGLLVLATPFLPQLTSGNGNGDGHGDGAPSPRRIERGEGAPSPVSIHANVKFTEVDLGDGLGLHDVALGADMRDGKPLSVSLTVREGVANPLVFALAPAGDHHTVTLSVADVPAWVHALTQPLLAAKLPPGPLADATANAAKVPGILKGGRLDFSGDLRLDDPAKRFEGKFALHDTTMIRPPVVLQLIALKTRSTMQVDPLLKEFSATRVYLNDTTVGAEGLSLVVSGLVNFLTLHTAHYGLQDESVYTDGKYGPFEFEVIGKRPTLGIGDVYLKENAVIRALGHESDLDFGDDPAPAKKP